MTNVSPFAGNRRKFLDLLGGLGAIAIAAPDAAFAQASGLSSIKIATIGAGREGGALGTLFAKLGHPVMFSSRHPEELKDLVAAAGPTAGAGTTAEAVAFGEVIFLAVPYTAVEQIGIGFRSSPRHQAAGRGCVQPDTGARWSGFCQSGGQRRWARPRHGEADPRGASCAGVQRSQLRIAGQDRASAREPDRSAHCRQ